MAEAIIGRSGVALSSGGGVSNETKKSLGLDNNATLDDVINTIVAKDTTMATMIVTIKNPDGTIPSESTKIKMVPVSGSTLEYSTNSVGQCLFKTNSGQCNFIETGDIPYIDLLPNSINGYEAVIGGVYHIDLIRKIRGIDESINLNSNQNIMFSNSCKSVDACCYGSGGGGGTGWCSSVIVTVYQNGDIKRGEYSGHCGGTGGNGYYNSKTILIEVNRNYNIFIGSGGNGGAQKDGTKSYVRGYSTMASKSQSMAVAESGDGYNGNTGGTVSFDNEIYAIGGGGGIKASSSGNGANGSGGNAMPGGSGGDYMATASKVLGSTSGGTAQAYTIGSPGRSGSNGYIILNNFTYK